MKQTLEIRCRCDVCGREIYTCDNYFKLPDGQIICGEDWDCLEEWAEEYKMPGVY